MRVVVFLMAILAQCARCAGIPCDSKAPVPSPLPPSIGFVQDALLLPEGGAVVVTHRGDRTDVIRISVQGEAVLSMSAAVQSDVAPSLIGKGEFWWFGRLIRDQDPEIVFASNDDFALKKRRLETNSESPVYWIPIDSETPAGIIVSVGEEQPALRFTHAAMSGIRGLGSVHWWQASRAMVFRHDSRWSAEMIGSDRYVVAAVDNPEESSPLRLWKLGDGAPEQFVVPCRMADRPIATAIDGEGRLIVVGVSPTSEVMTATVELGKPSESRCEVVSPIGERVAAMEFGMPQIVWTGRQYIAAWIRDDGSIRARELRRGDASATVTIGTEADTTMPLRQLLRLRGSELSFTWRDTRGVVLNRSMPTELAAFNLQQEARACLCDFATQEDAQLRLLRRILPEPLEAFLRMKPQGGELPP